MRAHVTILLVVLVLLQSILTPLATSGAAITPVASEVLAAGAATGQAQATPEGKPSAAVPQSSPTPGVESAGAFPAGDPSLAAAAAGRASSQAYFEANVGQTNPRVRFLYRGGGGTIFFADDELVLTYLPPRERQTPRPAPGDPSTRRSDRPVRDSRGPAGVARLRFVGANTRAVVTPGDQLTARINYLRGQDENDWQRNVPTYGSITYEELYPGTDLLYDGNAGQLKGTYLLAPGADPGRIQWKYGNGAQPAVDSAGNLQVRVAPGQGIPAPPGARTAFTITEEVPVAWQDGPGGRVPIRAAYRIGSDGTVGFTILDPYDPALPLVIDPTISYSSLLGGVDIDDAVGIDVDAAGAVYLTGMTYSIDFPDKDDNNSNTHADGDAFVTKLDLSRAPGQQLIYTTYLMGSDQEIGRGVAVDSQGAVYVTGDTYSTDLPPGQKSYRRCTLDSTGNCQDAFVAKLDHELNQVLYLTYLGSSAFDAAADIAVDGNGYAYVFGDTSGNGLPVKNAYQSGCVEDVFGICTAVFVTKLDPNQNGNASLLYSTYLDGAIGVFSYWYNAGGIAVDGQGNAYVAGTALLPSFPVTAGAYQALCPNNCQRYDAFVARLNTLSSGSSSLVFSSRFGGGNVQGAYSVALDSSAQVYVAGATGSTDFPTLNPAQSTAKGGYDAFLVKLSAAGSTLLYSTFLGGAQEDIARDVAIGADGRAYIAGYSSSGDFPRVNSFPDSSGTPAGTNVFISVLDTSATLSAALFSSNLIGGSGDDYAQAMALDGANPPNSYITGLTLSADFPVTANAYQSSVSDGDNAFIVKIGHSAPAPGDVRCGGSPSRIPTTLNAGSGVDTATGNLCYSSTEIAVSGRGLPLVFNAVYNSDLAHVGSGVTSTMGYGWTHNYNMWIDRDAQGNYLVHEENGAVTTFGADLAAPLGVRATLTLNSGTLQLLRIQDQLRFDFQDLNSSGVYRLTRVVDIRHDFATQLAYSNGYLQTATEDTIGTGERVLTFGYANGLLSGVSLSGPEGISIGLGYTSGELRYIQDLGEQRTNFTYLVSNGYRLLAQVEDPNGGLLAVEYHPALAGHRRVKKQTDPVGRTLDFGYTLTQTVMTDNLGLVTVHEYDRYLLRQVTENATGQQAKWSYSYKPGTRLVEKVQDPLLHEWHYEWDAQGNRTKVTDPRGHSSEYGPFGAFNNVQAITNAIGMTTLYGYESWGDLRTVTREHLEGPDPVTTYNYDDPYIASDLTSVADPLGKTTQFTYDAHGYLASARNVLEDETVSYLYDGVGRLQVVTDAMGFATTYDYNDYGNPTSVTDPLGNTTSYTYDANQNLKTVTDAGGHTTTYGYNKNDELVQVKHPDDTYDDYRYDGLGRVISHTGTLRQTTLYDYDDAARLVTVTDPLLRTTLIQYDKVGNVATVADDQGRTTSFTYYPDYQLHTVGYSDPLTPDVEYQYDPRGLRTAMSDGLGTTQYDYDSLDRLTSIEDPNGRTVAYTYYLNGTVHELYYPDIGTGQRKVTYSYDGANRPTGLQDWGGRQFSFGYDDNSALTAIGRPGSAADSGFGYDNAGRLTSILHAAPPRVPVFQAGYERGATGLLALAEESASGTHAYRYDEVDRLVEEQLQAPVSGVRTWSYDDGTNIVATTRSDTLSSIPVRPITAWSNLTNTTATGSTIQKTGGAAYQWDAAAVSTELVSSGDVIAQATAHSADHYTQFGLGRNNTGAGGDDIDFSIRLAEGSVQVFELGTQRGGSWTTYVAGDVFKVALEGGVVKYYKNGSAFYTSAVEPTYPLRFDSSLADPGSRIQDAHLTRGQCGLTWTGLDDVTANGNTIRKTGGVAYAWDAGALSSQVVSSGDVSAQATAHSADHYTQFGLGRNNTGADGDDIDFSIRLAEGSVQVFELGTQRGGNWATYVAGDLLKVAVEHGVARYYKNGVVFYTSEVAPTYPLRFDSSLADPNSRIWRAYLCAGPAPVMEWTGQASVSALSNTLTKTGSSYAWDAGAASSQSIGAGDVYAQATADGDQVYTQFGLGHNNTTAHGEDIDFSIRLAEGSVQVFELGTQRSGNFGTYEAGDVFTVAVVGGVARYYKNGVRFYTSLVQPTYPLRFDSSIGDPGARILSAQFGAAATTAGSTTRTYDDADQLLTLVETLGGHTTRNLSFAYNQVGERTRLTDTVVSGANTTYAYDQAGRLTSFARAGNSTSYRYNGDGLRLRKTKGASTEYFTWDASGLLLQDGNAAYVYGPGGMLLEEILNSGSVYYYHTDQLGSVRALTNTGGQVVATYEYDAYGSTISSTGTILNPFRYAGEYTDSESGLIYLRARYYDPATQVFLTQDPIGSGQPYAYAAGNPANLTDPGGTLPIAPLLVGAAISLGAGVAIDYLSNPVGFDLGSSLAGQFSDPLTYIGVIPGGAVAKLAQAGKLGNLAAGALRILGAGCSFSGETLVSTEDGLRPISEIEVGDRVLAYDEATGTTGYYAVTAVLVHEDPAIQLITIDGEELETTPEHPFYTQEKGWVPAGELWVSAHVRRANGGYGVVEAIQVVQQAQRMYNLSVARAHTFFVGSLQLLVHNTCPSQILAGNLGPQPVGTAAHHIVAHADRRAARSRVILQREGIGINESINGVYLPRNTSVPNPGGALVHSTIHTNRYHAEVTRRLSRTAPGTVRNELALIRNEILAGTFPR